MATINRALLGCLLILVNPLLFAQDVASYYLVQYSPGKNWNEKLADHQQAGLKKHNAYLEKLRHSGQLLLSGPREDKTGSVLMMQASSMAEANAVLAADPGILGKMLTAEIIPWRVNLSSVRFVPRAKPLTERDPEQRYRLKRVDPRSPVNIDQ